MWSRSGFFLKEKMKHSKYLLFLAALCFLTTCKKYPEGPFISFEPKTLRVEGSWNIEKYLVDDADSTVVKYSSGCTILFDATAADLVGHDVLDHCHFDDGHWEFDDHKKTMNIYRVRDSLPNGPLFLSDKQQWRILKLKHEEMHLQTDFNSKRYDIYLKR